MGPQKSTMKGYRSTDPTLATPQRAEIILRQNGKPGTSVITANKKNYSPRLFNIKLISAYLLQKFQSVYSAGQKLSLD